MESKNQNIIPEGKKSSNDFIKLLIGIIVVIAAMVALKFLASALGMF